MNPFEYFDEDELVDGECRVCGCSALEPCDGGCIWVQPDLCSSCVALAADHGAELLEDL